MNHSLFYLKENQTPPAYSSLNFFIFLSLQFSNIKKIISLFSGTEKPTKLKLGPHMDSRLTYGPRQANLVLIAYASGEGSGEPAHPRSLARTSAARSYKQ